MTNALGLQLNSHSLKPDGKYSGLTLGAFRRGKYITWIPGAVIKIWIKCARTENATGVPWPHAMFMQSLGDRNSYQGIFCPQCRKEVSDLRASGQLQSSQPQPKPKPPKPQLSLF